MEVTFMRKLTLLTIVLVVLALTLVACGGSDSDDTAVAGGDAAAGDALYHQTVIGPASAPGCVTCHSMEPDTVIVGPSHAGVATRAETYVAGMAAEEYLRESITAPDAHIVEGFTPGVMYQNYATDLTPQEIDNLVAYLLTLK
jgi:cytochrome c551/c552